MYADRHDAGPFRIGSDVHVHVHVRVQYGGIAEDAASVRESARSGPWRIHSSRHDRCNSGRAGG